MRADAAFDKALWARDVEARLPEKSKRVAFYRVELRLHSSTIALLERMVRAVRFFPDRAVWRALGWHKVEHLSRLNSARARAAACTRAMAKKAGPR